MSSGKKKASPPRLHKFMHPRNPYRTPPSFKSLALKYPEFRAHCIYELNGKVRLNFKDPNAVRALTTCLLDKDFDLKVSIPDGRLVPTLPLRLNYLLWIEELVTLFTDKCKKNIIVGVDIGCGSACVYPLLAAKKFGWCMVGTESDEINYNSAQNNVKHNSLNKFIIVKNVTENIIFKGIIDDENVINNITFSKDELLQKQNSCTSEDAKQQCSDISDNIATIDAKENNYIYDFTMCNPPFFSSEHETDSMKKSKRRRSEPSSAPTGALSETVTEGGEVAFISQMIDESLLLKDKIRIFTSMIGTKANIKAAKEKLKSVNPSHMSVVEFCQGRTMRWGLAWTYDANYNLENVLSKKQMADAKPLVLMFPRSLMTVYTVQAAWTMVNKWLHQLKINVQVFKNKKYFVGAHIRAFKQTWLHQRRKQREQKRKEADLDKKKEDMIRDKRETQPVIDENTLKRNSDLMQDTDLESCAKRQKITCNASSPEKKSNSEENNGTCMQAESHESICNSSETKFKARDSPGESSKGLHCILKAKLQLKQSGNLINLEATYIRGSAGKDGLNQLMQFMRNQVTKPPS